MRHIIVPDIAEVMRIAVERGLDLEDMLYTSPAGPITVRDVIWGYGVEIERNTTGNYEAHVLAFKSAPDASTKTLFGLPDA